MFIAVLRFSRFIFSGFRLLGQLFISILVLRFLRLLFLVGGLLIRFRFILVLLIFLILVFVFVLVGITAAAAATATATVAVAVLLETGNDIVVTFYGDLGLEFFFGGFVNTFAFPAEKLESFVGLDGQSYLTAFRIVA